MALADACDKITGGKWSSGSNRVNRGGSWNNGASNCRSANRNRNTPDNRNNNLGFRVAAAPSRRGNGAGRNRPLSGPNLQPRFVGVVVLAKLTVSVRPVLVTVVGFPLQTLRAIPFLSGMALLRSLRKRSDLRLFPVFWGLIFLGTHFSGAQVCLTGNSEFLVARRSKRSAEHRPACACGYGSNSDGLYRIADRPRSALPFNRASSLTAPRREARQPAPLSAPGCHPSFDSCRTRNRSQLGDWLIFPATK